MKITSDKFRRALEAPTEDKRLNIAFLGMSGSGKSHWSEQLSSAYNFERMESDDLTGSDKRIFGLLKDFEGEDLAEKMGHWFDKPWSEGALEREELYMSVASEIMDNLADLKRSGIVLDLAGSAIYHEEQMNKIAQNVFIICLDTNSDVKEHMIEIYLSDPKPLCWNGGFQINSGENEHEALKRCYSELIETRGTKYREYADVILPFDVHRNCANIKDFVNEVEKRLN